MKNYALPVVVLIAACSSASSVELKPGQYELKTTTTPDQYGSGSSTSSVCIKPGEVESMDKIAARILEAARTPDQACEETEVNRSANALEVTHQCKANGQTFDMNYKFAIEDESHWSSTISMPYGSEEVVHETQASRTGGC